MFTVSIWITKLDMCNQSNDSHHTSISCTVYHKQLSMGITHLSRLVTRVIHAMRRPLISTYSVLLSYVHIDVSIIRMI